MLINIITKIRNLPFHFWNFVIFKCSYFRNYFLQQIFLI
uniref:Uncharacterized protein n=1 Tax=Cryptosporidium parvum TaxID=5807 RepID=F0X658_CRYPV